MWPPPRLLLACDRAVPDPPALESQMPSKFREFARLIAVIGCATMLACSGEDATSGTSGSADGSGGGGGGGALFDGAGGNVETAGGDDTVTGNETTGTPDSIIGTDAVEPGGFGWPCKENTDCDTGLCIPTPDGSVCTIHCVEDCPDNFKCTAVTSPGGDVTYLCAPRFGQLCDPCNSNADCNGEGEVDNVCVAFGPDGSFCGVACGTGGACPGGTDCQTIIDPSSGKSSKQCLPTSGECSCSPKAIAQSLTTTCTNKNLYGACTGVRRCESGGLTACEAAVPAPEECNGVDDDCDGQTDNFDVTAKCKNTNEFGTCTGTLTACVDGKPKCDAPTPKPEICNGIDDDCDGGTDTDVEACDDGNPCTQDLCNNSGGCKYEPFNGPKCEDGNVCTTDDVCAEGKCQGGKPLPCDDGDPCSKDECAPASGCTHNPSTEGVCTDDGNPCTLDVCQAGKCAHVSVDDGGNCVDDGNPCTSDVCQKGVCTHPNVTFTVPCAEDGNECTADVCDQGGCTHQPLGSDKSCLEDGDACTNDVCILGKCSHPPIANGQPCLDDGEPCTLDACQGGKCTHPADNGKPCTEDGNPCTQDICQSGKCAHPAADSKPCDDDNNPCSKDICQAGSCKHPANTNASCDDGDPCTTTDYCDLGNGTGVCKGINLLKCDDGNPCTYDTCTKGQGCTYKAETGNFCNDGNVCSTGDVCQNGVCKGTGGKSCDDGNPCTDDGCDSGTGGCKFTANSLPCAEDGNLCTDDICNSKQCTHPNKKDDAPCADDGNPCTDGTCKSGVCKQTANSNVCNDGNACTSNDKCVGGACSGTAFKNCDDGNPCTQDSCDQFGQCTHKPLYDVSCKANSGECPTGICQGGSCVSKSGVLCQAKIDVDLCSSAKVPGQCSASGKCVATSVPPEYTCPGCNGICIKCLIFQFCVDLF